MAVGTLISEPDHYQMPNIMDRTNNIMKIWVFTKLDLLKEYFQGPVHPDDISKTAIITPFSSYGFYYSTWTPIFGQSSNCLVYINDILMFLDSPEEHNVHLYNVLFLLHVNKLIVCLDKCVFDAPLVITLLLMASSPSRTRSVRSRITVPQLSLKNYSLSWASSSITITNSYQWQQNDDRLSLWCNW